MMQQPLNSGEVDFIATNDGALASGCRVGMDNQSKIAAATPPPIRVAVISHALALEASWSRWQQLAARHPVEVTLIVPSPWESRHFGDLISFRPPLTDNGRFHVRPLTPTHRSDWTRYRLVGLKPLLRQIAPHVLYVMQEETTNILQQAIAAARACRDCPKILFFSWNNLTISPPLLQRLHWWRTRRRTDMAIAGNREVAHVLKRAGYSKPIIIQTEIGIDQLQFKPDPESGAHRRRSLNLQSPVIGYAGRLTEEKGVTDLFEALGRLSGPWSLLVVGDGPLSERLRDHASACHWSAHFTGFVPVEQMPGYLQAMDCLVLPSRTTPFWKEQFGLVLAQAMACGVPVVGSSSGAIPEVIGNAGLIFAEREPAALADCLRRMINDQSLRIQIGETGLHRARTLFSTECMADQTCQIFIRLTA